MPSNLGLISISYQTVTQSITVNPLAISHFEI